MRLRADAGVELSVVGAPELWIGVVEVRPVDGRSQHLGDALGAFVNIVTWASDGASYLRNAETVIAHLGGLFVCELVEAEPVRLRRVKTGGFNSEIEDLIERAEDNPDAIIYGTFHKFLNEDA
jgi:hypothetical protein